MLFDLRSRGRRRTVQGVYLGLALLMGGGLVLFGVGAGNGIGGLLNAFSNNGGGSSKPVVSQAEKSALRQTQLEPNNPAAWSALVEARYEAAGQDANQTTGTYTAAGVTKLRQTGQAWQRYLQLTKKPDWTLAELVAHAYEALGDAKDGDQRLANRYASQPDRLHLLRVSGGGRVERQGDRSRRPRFAEGDQPRARHPTSPTPVAAQAAQVQGDQRHHIERGCQRLAGFSGGG